MAIRARNNSIGATPIGRDIKAYCYPSMVVQKFEFGLNMAQSALNTNNTRCLCDRIRSAAENFEEGYNRGWASDGSHAYGKHAKAISKFRHLLFDALRRIKANAMTQGELSDLQVSIMNFLHDAAGFEFRNTDGQTTTEAN